MAMPLWLPTADLWSKIHAIGEYRYSELRLENPDGSYMVYATHVKSQVEINKDLC